MCAKAIERAGADAGSAGSAAALGAGPDTATGEDAPTGAGSAPWACAIGGAQTESIRASRKARRKRFMTETPFQRIFKGARACSRPR